MSNMLLPVETGRPHIDRAVSTTDRSTGRMQVPLSSAGLGWKSLEFERREADPSSLCLATGARRHLVFVILEGGVLERESEESKVRHRLSPGFVIVLPAAHSVRWSWDSRLSFTLLALQPEFLREVNDRHFDSRAGTTSLRFSERKQDPVIVGVAAALAREALHEDPGSSLYIESLASMLAVHLLREYGGRPADMAARPGRATSPRAISRALAFIQQNHDRPIGLADIAKSARLSTFHLSRMFSRTLGTTVHQHLIQTRVHSARALILAGGGQYSLAEIATAVGFADQSHLTRHFKRVLGTTPKKITQ